MSSDHRSVAVHRTRITARAEVGVRSRVSGIPQGDAPQQMRPILVLLLALLTVGAQAQSQEVFRIEVVSIKPTPLDTQGGSFVARPGGGVSAVNMPMSSLISLAYELPDS